MAIQRKLKAVSYNASNAQAKGLFKSFQEQGFEVTGNDKVVYNVFLTHENGDREKVASVGKMRPNSWSILAIDGLLSEV